VIASRLHDEHGGVLLITSVALIALILVVALVIDVANWKAHARHLQLQADAAAFAGAHSLTGGSCDNTLISNDAHKYSGSDVDSGGTVRTALYNDQLGGTAPSRMHVLINSAGYYGDATAGDNTDPNGSPCAAKYVDVKITETDLPWWFGAGLVRKLNAHARVSLLQESSANGTLPIAIPNPLPNSAAAIFINEATGAVLARVSITHLTTIGDIDWWQSAIASIDSLPTSTGVVIALSGRNAMSLTGTLTDICDQPLTDCYDAANDPPTIGVTYIRGYSEGSGTAPNPPVLQGVEMFGLVCTGSAYFSDGTCNYQLVAKIDAGANFAKAQQVYGANGVTMGTATGGNCDNVSGSGDCWVANMTVPANNGPQTINISWEITGGPDRNINGRLETCSTSGGNKCKGVFAAAARPYSALDTRSGPLKRLVLYNCDDGSCAVQDKHSYPSGNPHSFRVSIGIGGTLQNATSISAPLVVLRVRSQANQALDCDPGYTNLKDELALGCRPTYVPNTGSPDCSTLGTSALWATSQPWSCIAVSTGQQPNQVAAGLNRRIHGDEQATDCDPNVNNWHLFDPLDSTGNDGFPPGDPRILNAYITTYGAFSHVNGTSGSVPVIAFGHFYITGYTGQGGGFNNPCLASPPSNYGGAYPDDPVPNNDPGLIVGHFIYYVDRVGGDGTVTCNPSSINACVIVMTK
jgi:hypothetical protein